MAVGKDRRGAVWYIGNRESGQHPNELMQGSIPCKLQKPCLVWGGEDLLVYVVLAAGKDRQRG